MGILFPVMVHNYTKNGFEILFKHVDGEVQFGVRTVAPAGSPLCNAPPAVTYEHLDRGAYFGADAQLPWRNPVSVVTNLFS